LLKRSAPQRIERLVFEEAESFNTQVSVSLQGLGALSTPKSDTLLQVPPKPKV